MSAKGDIVFIRNQMTVFEVTLAFCIQPSFTTLDVSG